MTGLNGGATVVAEGSSAVPEVGLGELIGDDDEATPLSIGPWMNRQRVPYEQTPVV